MLAWDMSTQRLIAEFPGHISSINTIAFSGDGRYAVTASDDRHVKLWESGKFRSHLTLAGHLADVHSAKFTSDMRTIASADSKGAFALSHTESGQELFDINFAPAVLMKFTFSPDDRLLACLLDDSTGSGQPQTVRILQWRAGRYRLR
jgi:WD40 repeat protein